MIATGGGCVTRPENYSLLHQNGRIIWIKREISTLPIDGRPLSETNKLEEMYAVRKPKYESFSDTQVDNNGALEDTVKQILIQEGYA